MTVYTDGVHLITDQKSFDELHAFAERMGLKRCWFHRGDHYDLTTRAKAIQACLAGAKLISAVDLGKIVIRTRSLRAGIKAASPLSSCAALGGPDWVPLALDPKLAAEKNTELMCRFGLRPVRG